MDSPRSLRIRLRRPALGCLAAAQLLLAACGVGKEEDEVLALFASYRGALRAGDMEGIRATVAAEKLQDLESADPDLVLELLSQFMPAQEEILAVSIDGDSASLSLRAAVEGQGMTGAVHLARQGGAWRILEEKWEIHFELGDPASSFGARFDATSPRLDAALVIPAHDGAVTSLAFTPDGRYLVSIGYGDNGLRLWDLTSQELADEVECPHRPNDMVVTPDGGAVIVSDVYGNITEWPLQEGRLSEPKSFAHNGGHITQMALSADGKLLATTSFQGPVALWDRQGKRRTKTLAKSESQRGVAFSPREPLLVCGGYENTYSVWNLAAGGFGQRKKVKIPKVGEQSDVWCIAISPDGRYLVTGHMDSSITIWDLERRKQLHNFFVRDAATHAAAFSPDGAVVATGQQNGRIYFWNPESGKELLQLGDHGSPVVSLAFCAFGEFLLASGADDGQIIVWQ